MELLELKNIQVSNAWSDIQENQFKFTLFMSMNFVTLLLGGVIFLFFSEVGLCLFECVFIKSIHACGNRSYAFTIT